jgi:hypothetical protein
MMFKPSFLFHCLISITLLFSGECIEEDRLCMESNSTAAIASAALTTGSCKTFDCPSGCCRYHTAFLTCDEEDEFSHQACVCNDSTNNTHLVDRGATPAPGPGVIVVTPAPALVIVATPPPNASPMPTTMPSVSPMPSDSTMPSLAPVTSSPEGDRADGDTSCANGSVFQTAGTGYANCAANSDCAGIMVNGAQTCCKRTFCLCMDFADCLT